MDATVSATRPLSVDVPATGAGALSNAIERLYDGSLDLFVVRGAVTAEPLRRVAEALDEGTQQAPWNHPNAAMPPEDIQVLGTAATPTYSAPRGPSLDAYLSDAGWYGKAPVFGGALDPATEIVRVLSRFSSGKPVELLQSPDGRAFAPFTVRRLLDGKGIGLHHDLHLSLQMFKAIEPMLDSRTLVSYVITLQGPESGGELVVYDLPPDAPDPPKHANGFSWDAARVEAGYASQRVPTDAGDLFVFASARCLHRVAPVSGPKARITMGGFLALDKAHSRVLFWS